MYLALHLITSPCILSRPWARVHVVKYQQPVQPVSFVSKGCLALLLQRDASHLDQHGACDLCTSSLLSNNACVSHTCTRPQEAVMQ